MVGMFTLIIYCAPTSIRAHVEDVIVDEAMSGKGIGEALCGMP
jgi:hypothetical protein